MSAQHPAGRPLTASICLATHNGSAHLEEQLESLRAQSHAPSEVIVVDDASSDSTIDLLDDFAVRSEMSVRVSRHDTRLGAVASFQEAVQAATGDLIFLCDQDDIWLPSKVETFVDAFERLPAAAGVFCDSWVFTGEPSRGRSLFGLLGFSNRDGDAGIPLARLLRRNVASGHALAFRAHLRPLLLPFSQCLYHDAWIAVLLASLGTLVPLGEPLVLHRQHGANLVGARRRLAPRALQARSAESQRALLRLSRGYVEVADRLALTSRSGSVAEVLVREKAEHLRVRGELDRRRRRRVMPIVREVRAGRYGKYSASRRCAVTDLITSRVAGARPLDLAVEMAGEAP